MKTEQLIQGSNSWLAYRACHFNASDAPAMMGCSPHKTRAQLLREMHTGVAAYVDAGTQARFAAGHRAEALARPLAEMIIDEDLYPVTGNIGRLSASFDGITLDERICFEHKCINAELRDAFEAMDREFGTDDSPHTSHKDNQQACRLLPLHYRVQMEQQLLVSGGEAVLFMTTSWTDADALSEERHCWYYPDPVLRQQIVDGWAQFERELAAYVLPQSAEPEPVGRAPESLPALRIEITGAVTASNLAEFRETALGAIRSVNRDLQTDQHFADAEVAVKWCSDVEKRLAEAKERALSQTYGLDALFRTIDDISAEARRVRLDLDKLVTRRKSELKEAAVMRARRALDAHIAALDAELAPVRLQPVHADFAGAAKGKRLLSSLDDALDHVLAAAKIEADAAARAIRANLASFQSLALAVDFGFLFPDLGQLAHKPADDFALAVRSRIETHRAAEIERQELERQRIRAEEEKRQHAERQRQERPDTSMPETASTVVPESISLAALPALRRPLADGLYGGVITLADGRNVAVVYLHEAKQPNRASVDTQRAWAKTLGAQLITRAIGSLLVSTLGDLLPETWVWTEEDDANNPSAYAWYCYLGDGLVLNFHRSSAIGAVAVRLIPLT